MYEWRKLTNKQRNELLDFRRRPSRRWHSPPHFVGSGSRYLLTASCYEHRPLLGRDPERMAGFSEELFNTIEPHCDSIAGWCVLPNHYHALVHTHELRALLAA